MLFFFFFNDTATTEIYTLSLHDALPILYAAAPCRSLAAVLSGSGYRTALFHSGRFAYLGMEAIIRNRRYAKRSEEHTSELQSRLHLVCRLLLEKKKNTNRLCSTATDTPA